MLKLHHFDRSPYGWKVRLVLHEKGIAYESVIPQNKSEDPQFAQLNPFRLTPVLELEDGRTIYESTVINEYLEDRYPQPAMLPRDPYERARVRFLEDTTDQYVGASVRKFVMSQYDYAPPLFVPKASEKVDTRAVAEGRAEIDQHLIRLERELAGRTWFGGDVFSLADATLAPILTGTLALHGLLPDARLPNLAAWAARIADKPAYQAAKPQEPMRIQR